MSQSIYWNWVVPLLIGALGGSLTGLTRHKNNHYKEFRHQETCKKCKLIGWLKI